jgi:RNA polymerase sigma-70 factor (TIGR02943 family)
MIMAQRLSDKDQPTPPQLLAPTEWLKQYGDALYRYALSRLRRSQDAEDAVQETLLTAFKAQSQFEGRAQPLTWLMEILKSRIIDRMRLQARQAAEVDPAELDSWFNASGHWRRSPKKWDDPAAFAERAEFWQVVGSCLAKLPARMAEAFTLRTIEEQKGDEVCRELEISPANLWVLLHRARLRLVRCLEINWFNVKHET